MSHARRSHSKTPSPQKLEGSATSIPPAQTGIRLGFGSFSAEIPRWFVELFSRNVVLASVFAICVFNLYYTYTSRNGTAFSFPPAATGVPTQPKSSHPPLTQFSKTFMFWVPDFSTQTKKFEPQFGEERFNQTLTERFGGWTRWRASGSGAGAPGVEDGWIYQASLPKAPHEDLSVKDVEQIVREHFREKAIYVVELRHQ
jgi:hypothetical protein